MIGILACFCYHSAFLPLFFVDDLVLGCSPINQSEISEEKEKIRV